MSVMDRIEASLDTMRPYLANDGGNVEVVSYEDGVVSVRLLGSCATCAQSHMTMKAGIEGAVKNAIPEVTSVVAVD